MPIETEQQCVDRLMQYDVFLQRLVAGVEEKIVKAVPPSSYGRVDSNFDSYWEDVLENPVGEEVTNQIIQVVTGIVKEKIRFTHFSLAPVPHCDIS